MHLNIVTVLLIGLIILLLIRRFILIGGGQSISTSELKACLHDQSKQFIDVRTKPEFRTRSIKGFKNIPLQNLNIEAKSKLSTEKEVVIICQSGMRSRQASKQLKKMGFSCVTNVKGGMKAWNE